MVPYPIFYDLPHDVRDYVTMDEDEVLASPIEDRALAAWIVLEFIEQRAAEVQRETIELYPEELRLDHCVEAGMSKKNARAWLARIA